MKADDTTIVLCDDAGRKQISAPEGFDWQNYPGAIVREGLTFLYIGTIEGTPHYAVKKGE